MNNPAIDLALWTAFNLQEFANYDRLALNYSARQVLF